MVLEKQQYEVVIVFNPNHSNQIGQSIKSLLQQCEIQDVHLLEDWGRRKLAYSIKHLYMAHYVLLLISCHKDQVNNLRKEIQFKQEIIRYMILKCKEFIPTDKKMVCEKSSQDLIESVGIKITPLIQQQV